MNGPASVHAVKLKGAHASCATVVRPKHEDKAPGRSSHANAGKSCLRSTRPHTVGHHNHDEVTNRCHVGPQSYGGLLSETVASLRAAVGGHLSVLPDQHFASSQTLSDSASNLSDTC